MSVSFFPTQNRVNKNALLNPSAHDLELAELLNVLGCTVVRLGTTFKIDELSSLSGSIAGLQSSLLATSERSVEGIIVRQRCQQMLESAACVILELARNNARPQIEIK